MITYLRRGPLDIPLNNGFNKILIILISMPQGYHIMNEMYRVFYEQFNYDVTI